MDKFLAFSLPIASYRIPLPYLPRYVPSTLPTHLARVIRPIAFGMLTRPRTVEHQGTCASVHLRLDHQLDARRHNRQVVHRRNYRNEDTVLPEVEDYLVNLTSSREWRIPKSW